MRAIERAEGAIQVIVLRDLNRRGAVAVGGTFDAEGLRPRVRDTHLEATREATLEPRLQCVVYTKVNWNATSKLNIFGRYSHLDFWTFNETIYGDQRLGVTYRATTSMVLRAGFGITNDPYSLARPLRTNHPVLVNLVVPAAHSWASAGRLADGIPAIPEPDLGNGIIPIQGNITAFTLPNEFNRGSIRSWNVAIEKQLKWGFVGEAAYVGTRQIDQLGFTELNWSPIGGGQAGRQLNRRFGRTAQTRIVAPIGDSQTLPSCRLVPASAGSTAEAFWPLSPAVGR